MRQQFRLALDEIGEMLPQNTGDPCVQFLAAGAQQCAMGGILDQRMLEQIGGQRRRALAE
jgi:hypothetical protein